MLDGRAAPCSNRSATSIEPEEIIKRSRRGILRLWAASVEFSEDVRISPTILTRLSEAYRKLRNTFRYCWATFTISIRAPTPCRRGEMLELDQWILLRAEDLVARCRAWYDEFAFHKVYRAVYDFRHGRSELDLLRHAEGSAVHLGAEIAGAAQRADRALPAAGIALVRLLAPDPRASPRKKSGRTWSSRAAYTWRYFPSPAN